MSEDSEDISEDINEQEPPKNENYISKLIEESIVGNIRENEIRPYIIKKLILFNLFNNELESLINRKKIEKFSYCKYYIIKPFWMFNFLKFYNYHEILPIIQSQSNNLKLDDLCKKVFKIVKKQNIREAIYGHEELEGNFNNILRSENEFFPEKKRIVDENKNKIIKYYNDFIILDENLYDEIKDDKGNTHTFLHKPKKVKIFLNDKIFIYQIKDNIIGFGVPLKSDHLPFYLFKVLIIVVGDKKFDNEIEIERLKSEEILNLIDNKIRCNDLNIKILKLENQNSEKIILIKDPINFTFEENSKKNINFLDSIKKGDYHYYSNKRYEVINDEEKKKEDKSEVSNNIDNSIIKEINELYTKENIVGDGNCLFNAFSQLIFGNQSYADIIREKICEYNKKNSENFIEDEEKEKYFKNMRKDREYGGFIEIRGFSFFCDIKLTCYVMEIDMNSNKIENTQRYVFNEEKEGNFALIMEYYKNNERKNHFSSLKSKKGIGISDEKLQQIKEILIKEQNNSSFENHEYINNVINNNKESVILGINNNISRNQQKQFGWKDNNNNSPDYFKNTSYTIIGGKDNPDYDYDDDEEELEYLKELGEIGNSKEYEEKEIDLDLFQRDNSEILFDQNGKKKENDNNNKQNINEKIGDDVNDNEKIDNNINDNAKIDNNINDNEKIDNNVNNNEKNDNNINNLNNNEKNDNVNKTNDNIKKIYNNKNDNNNKNDINNKKEIDNNLNTTNINKKTENNNKNYINNSNIYQNSSIPTSTNANTYNNSKIINQSKIKEEETLLITQPTKHSEIIDKKIKKNNYDENNSEQNIKDKSIINNDINNYENQIKQKYEQNLNNQKERIDKEFKIKLEKAIKNEERQKKAKKRREENNFKEVAKTKCKINYHDKYCNERKEYENNKRKEFNRIMFDMRNKNDGNF